ncbi:MAG: anthranilate phosphoribosyltransferase [Atribacterota bacterium]
MKREAHEILNDLCAGNHFSFDGAGEFMEQVMDGQFTPSQTGAMLCALRLKGETPDEIAGFALAMREKAIPFPLESNVQVMDNCGTGGDKKKTFNISTSAALLACALGLKIVKHGNRSVSSLSGSADFLEALGIRIDLPPENMKKLFEETGFAFLYAPLYHPAMKAVQQVRRELGIRTIFNILGPLTNPALVSYKMIGVYDELLVLPLAQALAKMGVCRGLVYWGQPGMDEISLSGTTKMAFVEKNTVRTFDFHPEELHFAQKPWEELRGGTPQENAHLFDSLLQGTNKGTIRESMVLNTAFLAWVSDPSKNLEDIVQEVEGVIDSGKALQKMKQLVRESQRITSR